MQVLISAWFKSLPTIETSEQHSIISIIMKRCSLMPWRIPRFKMKTVDRVWFLSHCEWIFANRQRLKDKPCTEFVITGFIINSFGCPYYGYAIDKITLSNLIKLWDNGFVYKDFPLIHYRISHGDSSTHIAYIYRGKVFSHRFSYTDPTRYTPTEEVRKILRELRKSKP